MEKEIKQQTALDYYSKQIGKLTLDLVTGKITGKQYVMLEIKLLEQAKEIEKEKMIDFAIAYSAQDQYKTSAEDYYTENYGGAK
jgi:hypothetical protein